MKYLSSILVITVFSSVFICAQENDKNLSLKLYANGEFNHLEFEQFYSGDISSYKEQTQLDDFIFGGISFGLEINNNKFFTQEIELTPLKFNIADEEVQVRNQITDYIYSSGGAKTTRLDIGCKYQLSHKFAKGKKVQPSIGMFSHLYENLVKTSPYASNYYETYQNRIGFAIGVTPAIYLNMGEHASLNLSVPYDLVSLNFITNGNKNPSIPVKNQVNSVIEIDELQNGFLFRVGFAYRL